MYNYSIEQHNWLLIKNDTSRWPYYGRSSWLWSYSFLCAAITLPLSSAHTLPSCPADMLFAQPWPPCRGPSEWPFEVLWRLARVGGLISGSVAFGEKGDGPRHPIFDLKSSNADDDSSSGEEPPEELAPLIEQMRDDKMGDALDQGLAERWHKSIITTIRANYNNTGMCSFHLTKLMLPWFLARNGAVDNWESEPAFSQFHLIIGIRFDADARYPAIVFFCLPARRLKNRKFAPKNRKFAEGSQLTLGGNREGAQPPPPPWATNCLANFLPYRR